MKVFLVKDETIAAGKTLLNWREADPFSRASQGSFEWMQSQAWANWAWHFHGTSSSLAPEIVSINGTPLNQCSGQWDIDALSHICGAWPYNPWLRYCTAFRKTFRLDAKVSNCVGFTTSLDQLSHWLLGLTVTNVLLVPLFFIINWQYSHVSYCFSLSKKLILAKSQLFPQFAFRGICS